MTRLFEVTKRDGAARLGKLMWRGEEVVTPCSFESKEDLEFLKESTIHRAEIDVTIVAAQEETSAEQIDADVVILAGAARFRDDPRGLTKALLRARELANPDSALYAPALATPENVSLLVYAGVDLVDSVVAGVKAREGYFLDADGGRRFDAVSRRPCLCSACNGANVTELSFEHKVALASDHNKRALKAELNKIAENVERGTLRELVEGRCRSAPVLTALLRLLDDELQLL